MNAATLGIASDFVKTGIERAGIPLSGTLEAYLSHHLRPLHRQRINVDLLTVRVTRAMDAERAARRDPRPRRRVPDRLRLLRAAAAAQRHHPPLCRPRAGELRRRRAHRAGLRLRAHARRDRQRRRRPTRPEDGRCWSTAPAPAARPRATSSPSRTSWSAPGAGAEGGPALALSLTPCGSRSPGGASSDGPRAVELAELGHDADQHAAGPAEGEKARHGDHRPDQPPVSAAARRCPRRGSCSSPARK